MALQDRIVRKDSEINDISPVVYYSAFYLWVTGNVTGADVAARFSLNATEQTQSQNLKAVYDGLSTNIEKLEYLNRVHAALIAYENLLIDKSELVTTLGL